MDKIIKYKNFLAIYGVIIMLIFTIVDPTGYGKSTSFVIKTIAIIWPLGMSSLLWNKKMHDGIIETNPNISYTGFMLFGFVIILFFDTGMTIVILNYFLK